MELVNTEYKLKKGKTLIRELLLGLYELILFKRK